MGLQLLGAVSIGAARAGLPELLSHFRVDADGVPCEWVEATRATQGQQTIVYFLGAEARCRFARTVSALRSRVRHRDRCPHPHGRVRWAGEAMSGTRSRGVCLASGRGMRHQGDRFHGPCWRHARGRRLGGRQRPGAAASQRRSLAFALLTSQCENRGRHRWPATST